MLLDDEAAITRDLKDAAQCQIPIVTVVPATEVVAGSDRTAGAGRTERSVVLTQNPSIEASETIPFEQRRKLPWNILTETAGRMVGDLAAQLMLRFVNYMAGKVADGTNGLTLNHIITSTFLDTDSGLATAVRDATIKAGTLFDLRDMPRTAGRRRGWLHPNLFNQIPIIPEMNRGDYGGEKRARRPGNHTVYNDFDIWSTPAGFNTDSSALGTGGLTPAKYRKDLSPAGLATGGVYGIFWDSKTVAQGWATMGPSHIEIMEPWYDRRIKSWVLNVAAIYDVECTHLTGAVQATEDAIGIVRLDDDGV